MKTECEDAAGLVGDEATLSGSVSTRTRARKLNAKGETRLHVAARLNKITDVVTLLMEGAEINAKDYAGLSFLSQRHVFYYYYLHSYKKYKH